MKNLPTPFSQITAKPIQWLWQNRVPRGKLTLLCGDPTSGKTSLLLHLAAQLSKGQLPSGPLLFAQSDPPAALPPFADSLTRQLADSPLSDQRPLATLLLSPEDNAADTLLPRLQSMNANLDLISILPDLRSLVPPKNPDAPNPLEILEIAIQNTPNLALIVIDPIIYYLGFSDRQLKTNGGGDPDSPRTVLQALANLAEKYNLAIILTTRLIKKLPDPNKPYSDADLHRAVGSLDFVTAARSILILLPHSQPSSQDDKLNPSDAPNRLLLSLRSPVIPAKPIPLRIDNAVTIYPPTRNPFAPAQPRKPGPAAASLLAAQEWLLQRLAHGPVNAHKIIEDARANAISKSTLDRAKAVAGIQSTHQGWSKRWFWHLPDDTRPLPEVKWERELHEEFQSMENFMNQETPYTQEQLHAIEHLSTLADEDDDAPDPVEEPDDLGDLPENKHFPATQPDNLSFEPDDLPPTSATSLSQCT